MMSQLPQTLLSGTNKLFCQCSQEIFYQNNFSLPGTSDADAERRRKKALAVLSKRLQSVETQEDAWSDDDDPKPTKGTNFLFHSMKFIRYLLIV